MASIFVLKAPLKVFVQKNVREKDLALFSELSREPRPLPQMKLRSDVQSILDFRYEDFSLENYQPHPHIPAPVAV